MNVLIDMNLSPRWTEVFARIGWHAVHWSTVGDPRAPDRSIMEWARDNGYIVFTHDLDFGSLLAVTQSDGPSVIQLRAQDVLSGRMEGLVVASVQRYQSRLESGALIVIDQTRSRARILPLSD